MQDIHPIWALGFFTILTAIGYGIFFLMRQAKRPGGLHPMEGQRERNIAEIHDEAGVNATSSEAAMATPENPPAAGGRTEVASRTVQ